METTLREIIRLPPEVIPTLYDRVNFVQSHPLLSLNPFESVLSVNSRGFSSFMPCFIFFFIEDLSSHFVALGPFPLFITMSSNAISPPLKRFQPLSIYALFSGLIRLPKDR